MSYFFEAILTESGSASAIAAASPDLVLNYQTKTIVSEVHVFFRSATREDPIDLEGLLADAARLTRDTGKALAVVYDDRLGYRESWLFESGMLQQSFSESDEQWVPTDDHGEPVVGAVSLNLGQLDPEVEYECSKNAIDLGIEAMGLSAVVSCSILRDHAH